MIKKIKENSQSSESGKLRRGMDLLYVGHHNVTNKPLKDILDVIAKHERPMKLSFKTLPSRSLSPSRVADKVGRSLSPTPIHRRRRRAAKHTVTVSFGPGPMGLELCPRLKGGVMIKSLTPGGQASQTNQLRRSMLLVAINKDTVQDKELHEIITSIQNVPRPVDLTFREIKHIKMDEQKNSRTVKAANKVSAIVEVEYTEGPIGLELIPKKRGGTMIKKIKENSQSSESGKLRRGMDLLYVGHHNVTNKPLKDILDVIAKHERPMKLSFKTLPSRSLSPSRVADKVGRSLSPTPIHRRRRRAAKHTVTVSFGPGPMGLELCPRLKGGVMIKSLTPGGQASQTNQLRRSMVLVAIDKNDCSKNTLKEILAKIQSSQRPIELSFHELSSISYKYDAKNVGKMKSKIKTVFPFEGPLGIELVQKKGNQGVMVKNVLPSGFAVRTRKIRKAMSLLEINGKDVATERLANIVELLQSSGRPLTLMWASAPSRQISPSAHSLRSKRKEAAEALESIFSELDSVHAGSVPKESIVKAATLGKFNDLSSKYIKNINHWRI